jgi:molecular chaperone DnaK
LSESEVERMKREAETHADEDKKRKELIEARNTADNAIYTAEKALRDLGDKVPADVKSKVETEIGNVRTALGSDDAARIKSATEQLFQVVQQIGASVYQGSAPEAGPTPGGEEPGTDGEQKPGGDEDVVDGEFRES